MNPRALAQATGPGMEQGRVTIFGRGGRDKELSFEGFSSEEEMLGIVTGVQGGSWAW